MLPVLVIGVVAASAFIEAAVQLVLGPEQDGRSSSAGSAGRHARAPRWAASANWSTGIGDFGLDPTDAAIRTLVAAGITAIVAFAVYRLHLDWRRGLIERRALPRVGRRAHVPGVRLHGRADLRGDASS